MHLNISCILLYFTYVLPGAISIREIQKPAEFGSDRVWGLTWTQGKAENLPQPKGQRERPAALELHFDPTSHTSTARRTHARNETISRLGPYTSSPPTSDLLCFMKPSGSLQFATVCFCIVIYSIYETIGYVNIYLLI